MAILLRYLIYLLPVVQCLCMVHVYRTGKPSYWFYIILFFPGIGSAVYLIAEVLPSTRWDRLIPAIDVNLSFLDFFKKRRLEKLADLAEFAPTVENRTAYADELANQGQLQQAIELYDDCMRGPMKDDVHLLLASAEIREAARDWNGVLSTLAKLRPDDLRQIRDRVQRFQAVALHELGRSDEAEVIYRDLLDGWPGEEIRFRLASLKLQLNQKEEAIRLLEEIKRNSKRGNSHYRRVNRIWIRWANHILTTEAKAKAKVAGPK